jgi:hypothetical protein
VDVTNRCFTSLSEKVSQTSALEDRRLRRDLQDTFIRLMDAAILVAGRVIETTGWPRRTTVSTVGEWSRSGTWLDMTSTLMSKSINSFSSRTYEWIVRRE